VETFRTNLVDAIPFLLQAPSARTKYDSEQIINGCSRALQEAMWRVQHQAMQRAELLCSHSFATLDPDLEDRIADIYTCADQLKSFAKYIHHPKADVSFDPRYVFEDICHHLADSIFDLQSVAAPQTPTAQQKSTPKGFTPTMRSVSPATHKPSPPISESPKHKPHNHNTLQTIPVLSLQGHPHNHPPPYNNIQSNNSNKPTPHNTVNDNFGNVGNNSAGNLHSANGIHVHPNNHRR